MTEVLELMKTNLPRDVPSVQSKLFYHENHDNI